ncbi:type IV toxin-antitoxin system AbiEi family antitoxin [Pedobacter jamesrossensis]|uniref:Type IV toxin-antitoxin system AbiEi family antitoxin n=1 Tax=Pedobacter jamesrossensis TaxID=1908238 RepID=A0ABV8NKN3_9SPHI
MKEEQILLPVLTRFTEITGIEARILRISEGKKASFDAVLEISRGQQNYILEVDVKSEIRTAALSSILSKQRSTDGKLLMVSRYIPAPMKDELKSHGISYIEGSGNCYIETRGIYVYVNDQKTAPLKMAEETKLWAPSGMKFIFAVLMDKELLNSSYRNIAYTAGVALGNIGSFINELKREGYVILGTRQKQEVLLLENRMMLIEKWADMYRAILRPKQLVGKFRFNNKEDRTNWHRQVAADMGIYWGAETAGAILTKYLSPQIYTIYSDGDRFELMKKLKIVPDQNGEVELLRPFWNEEVFSTDGDTVPPLLAYAELISSFDSRNRETAMRIKEKYVK